MDTTYDIPDWQSQMRDMLGPEADEMIRRFNHIIVTHIPLDEPVARVELAFSREELYELLPTIKAWLDTGEGDESKIRNLVWLVGLELCREYMTSDSIDYNEEASATIPYFFGAEDDWGLYDDDDDDDDDDD